MGTIHSTVSVYERESLQSLIGECIPSDAVKIIKNVTIPYDSTTKSYDYTNNLIGTDSFCRIHFLTEESAIGAEVRITKTDSTLHFTFESQPEETIVCDIIITDRTIERW